MRHINATLKTTSELSMKDMRNFNLDFTVGDYDKDKGASGINLKSRFGIIDYKSEPINTIKKVMDFNEKEPWILMKIHVDTSKGTTSKTLVEEFKKFKLFTLLDRYVKVHNEKNKDVGGASKVSIVSSEAGVVHVGI